MDNHHAIVARARAAADTTPRLYFGYSTILDREAFEAWRAQHGYEDFDLPEGRLARALDMDVVFDFPSRFWGGRVAGLSAAPGKEVHGLLFEIGGKDWAVIQHKEGHVTGMCVEQTVRVRVGDQELEATAFVTSPTRKSSQGPVSQTFVEAWLRGGAAVGLPIDYLARIRSMT
jgi:gamma-glutamylcyclotransferase